MKKLLIIFVSMSVTITVNSQCPDSNHPHMIDLGLSSGTKWACCNVGATSPEGYGGFYAWGETEEKSNYDWSTYNHCNGSQESCHNIGTDIAGTEYDVAHVKWGENWQMPSRLQCLELKNECVIVWTNLYGVNGCRFTGPNGHYIFLPASGERLRRNLDDVDDYGCYWTSSLRESFPDDAWDIDFDDNDVNGCVEGDGGDYRCYGHNVRPIANAGSYIHSATINNDQESTKNHYKYNLNGQRVEGQLLPKGLYILNGKKVLVK